MKRGGNEFAHYLTAISGDVKSGHFTTTETNGMVPVITKKLIGRVDNSSSTNINVDSGGHRDAPNWPVFLDFAARYFEPVSAPPAR